MSFFRNFGVHAQSYFVSEFRTITRSIPAFRTRKYHQNIANPKDKTEWRCPRQEAYLATYLTFQFLGCIYPMGCETKGREIGRIFSLLFMALFTFIFILIRSTELQQNADVYLLQNYSTCFGCLSHPSSGVRQTVTAVSGTGHSVRATTFRQRGLIRPRWPN